MKARSDEQVQAERVRLLLYVVLLSILIASVWQSLGGWDLLRLVVKQECARR